MTIAPKPVRQKIQDRLDHLTQSERAICKVLMTDYPVSGLQSITKVALLADVSTPTVIRLARKLGFDGFPHMQSALREEAAAQIKKPMSKREAWVRNADATHPLNRFAEAVTSNMQHTLERIDTKSFDAVARLLAQTNRPIYVTGGRITRSVADYMFNHLQIIRPRVTLMDSSPNVWPHYLLDMDESSVLVLFDIRRYERNLERLAEIARERGANVILFTDPWGSPVTKSATHCFNSYVEVPSSWDSTIALTLLTETLIAEVQSALWDESKERIEELEAALSATRLFRTQP